MQAEIQRRREENLRAREERVAKAKDEQKSREERLIEEARKRRLEVGLALSVCVCVCCFGVQVVLDKILKILHPMRISERLRTIRWIVGLFRTLFAVTIHHPFSKKNRH